MVTIACLVFSIMMVPAGRLQDKISPRWVATFGGLLVGLLVKAFGDHSGIFPEVMREFGKTGRFDYRNAPGIVVTALVSLTSGASLGPEAPLIALGTGIALWIGRTIRLSPGGQIEALIGVAGAASAVCVILGSPLTAVVLLVEVVALAGGPVIAVMLPALLGVGVIVLGTILAPTTTFLLFRVWVSHNVSIESMDGTINEFNPAYTNGAAKNKNNAETGI